MIDNDDMAGGAFMAGDSVSPFKPPNEEQVFITREAEKQKKKEAKEAAKHLKIWDKKTATSRMPLKRVKDEDVKPLQSDENVYNFNANTRGFISAACLIAKSRVQFQREQRPQNIDEFVNQKKEMFLVELSNNTIENEIKDLELKKSRKEAALDEASKALEKDGERLIEFIEDDNMKTKRKQKDAEMAAEKRRAAESQINALDLQISNKKSEIDKNEDMLKALQDHKDFLFGIFQSVNPKWVQEQEEIRRRKKSHIKEEWTAEAKRNPERFLDDDQFLSEFSKPQDAGATSQAGSKLDATVTSLGRGKRGLRLGPKDMTDEDWGNKFEEWLAAELIDVPEDYYEEPQLFEDPDQLMSIFTSLEEKNLEIIKKSQDTEYSLEIRKQQELRTHKEIGGMITLLQHNA